MPKKGTLDAPTSQNGRSGYPDAAQTLSGALRASSAALAISERQFMAQIVRYAKLMGWHRIYHTHDSRRSAGGFPDLVLVRRPRVVFAELKSERGSVTEAQQAWITDLRCCGQEAYVWRPSDWPTIERTLR